MSGVESTEGETTDRVDATDYEEMLDVLDELLAEALDKVRSGRVYDATNEKIRIKWIRIAKDVVAERRKVTTERDLEELAAEVEKLKEESS